MVQRGGGSDDSIFGVRSDDEVGEEGEEEGGGAHGSDSNVEARAHSWPMIAMGLETKLEASGGAVK